MYYHIHQYFELKDLVEVQNLRDQIEQGFLGQIRVSGLVARKVGPHPLPMFEIIVGAEQKGKIKDYLKKYNGDRSALIHPVTENDLEAHTKLAEWIGPRLDLNLSIFK
jgi:aromatic ring-cleaving dioxygenase